MLSAISAARVLVRYLSTEAPSGDSADSQLFSAAMTRSAGSRARALRHALAHEHSQRWRLERDQVGQAPCDLGGQTALLGLPGQLGASGVDDRDEWRRSSAASRIPHRASRSAAGPTGWPSNSAARSCPTTTAGAVPKRASAKIRPASFSPSPVPCSGVTLWAACRSSARTPGRAGSRELMTTSQARRRGTEAPGSGLRLVVVTRVYPGSDRRPAAGKWRSARQVRVPLRSIARGGGRLRRSAHGRAGSRPAGHRPEMGGR
jgi:hypothetical protein